MPRPNDAGVETGNAKRTGNGELEGASGVPRPTMMAGQE